MAQKDAARLAVDAEELRELSVVVAGLVQKVGDATVKTRVKVERMNSAQLTGPE